jgi:hypothetical protein
VVGYGAVMAMRVFYRKDWIDGRGEVSRRFQSIASDVSRISAAKECRRSKQESREMMTWKNFKIVA